jgi:hypothetical protein
LVYDELMRLAAAKLVREKLGAILILAACGLAEQGGKQFRSRSLASQYT